MNSKTVQKFTSSIFILSGAFTLLILLVLVGFILINGFHVVNLEFLFSKPLDSGRQGGIFPMILSTVYLIVITTLISVPIGVGSAIYISEYASNKSLINVIRFSSQVLSSVPSIVFGLFGLAFLVIFLKMGWSILSGGVVLALMAIPTIFQVSEVSLQSVPSVYREGCYAMGATKWQCIISVLLPTAIPGICTGIILAITRAISEAAAVMYVVGSSLDVPISIFDTGRPLPLHLYILASEGISMDNAYGTATILIVMVLLITLISNIVIDNYQKKLMGC
ncbi:phosphate ABC transporter permease PstA [Methanobrevibacter sp.]|uniref:phosphate ABC transporter permease PstA n=1 Tax=Methanobrevibacter sp. TaxID=66852 RepID=UPI0026DFFEA1|nr:phosphate ABC transporter permease PstA [Methanobrevibacter sp.]MDO5859950.1 phosphate ABC transporter permease PstA [Methanobrevibacter sp.]